MTDKNVAQQAQDAAGGAAKNVGDAANSAGKTVGLTEIPHIGLARPAPQLLLHPPVCPEQHQETRFAQQQSKLSVSHPSRGSAYVRLRCIPGSTFMRIILVINKHV